MLQRPLPDDQLRIVAITGDARRVATARLTHRPDATGERSAMRQLDAELPAVRIVQDFGARVARDRRLAAGRWMKVTAATIDEANRRMAEIAADESLGDGYIRRAKMTQVWWPIMSATDRPDTPTGMFDDFVGFTDDGQRIVWAQTRLMPGTGVKWRELAVVGPKRSA